MRFVLGFNKSYDRNHDELVRIMGLTMSFRLSFNFQNIDKINNILILGVRGFKLFIFQVRKKILNS